MESMFPPPPAYYKQFAVLSASSKPTRPPVPVGEEFVSFGVTQPVRLHAPRLEGIPDLRERMIAGATETNAGEVHDAENMKVILRKLNAELLFAYVDLMQTLVDKPSAYGRKVRLSCALVCVCVSVFDFDRTRTNMDSPLVNHISRRYIPHGVPRSVIRVCVCFLRVSPSPRPVHAGGGRLVTFVQHAPLPATAPPTAGGGGLCTRNSRRHAPGQREGRERQGSGGYGAGCAASSPE